MRNRVRRRPLRSRRSNATDLSADALIFPFSGARSERISAHQFPGQHFCAQGTIPSREILGKGHPRIFADTFVAPLIADPARENGCEADMDTIRAIDTAAE
jgi:hypothetical protein